MELERRARAWRRQRRRAAALEGLVGLVGWGAAGFAALAAADAALSLPRGLRLAAWAGLAAGLAWRLWRDAASPWRAPGWDEAFAAASAAWPETRPLLASAWALRGDAARPGVSEELRLGHLRRADALAAALPEEPLFRWRLSAWSRRGLWAAALGLAAALSAGGSRSWSRVLAPWRGGDLDRLVALRPGDAVEDWGGSVEIGAAPTAAGAAAGLRPAELTLETRGEDGAWRPAAWDRVDGESAAFATGPLSAPLEYRARWRDLATASRRLRPVPAPRLGSATAVVHGARGERSFALGEDAPVRARRGDWVSVRGRPESPLAEAALRVSGSPGRLPMRRGDDGTWSAGFAAQEDATFSFLLVSADGRRDPSPPSYELAVAADAKPVVELLSPQVPLQAGPRDAVTVAYAARDDGALTRLELVVSAGGRENRRTLPLERGRGEVLGDAQLPLRSFSPGAVVEFWLEVADDASPPQTARSQKGSVEIVDADAAHAAALAAREEALASLERAADGAEAAASAAEAGRAAEAAEAARALSGRWAKSAERLMAWNQALSGDPRANPGLSEQVAAAAESLARAGLEALPAAAAALSKGDGAAAAREQRALAEQARGAAQALREGSRVQKAQDMAERAEGARRQGEELQSALEALAARGRAGTVSAREMSELRSSLSEVDQALEELRRAAAELPEISDSSAAGTAPLPLEAARQAAGELGRALASGDVAGAASAARRLAERLRELSRALREAGARAAQRQAQRAQEGASKAAQAWQEAEAWQERAVEAARRRDEARRAALLRGQRELLARLGPELDAAGSAAPSVEARALARRARAALDAGRAEEAVARLREAAAASRAAAVAAASSNRPASAAHDAAARAFGAAADELGRGAPPPPPEPGADREAAEVQASARGKAARLRVELAEAAKLLGYLPGSPVRRADQVMGEEDAAEGALRRGDAAEGLRRGEAALALLQEGEKNASAGSGSAGGMGRSMGLPFERSGGTAASAPGGTTGVGIGRVRLPTAEEYRPPVELREELERSLREPRPAAHDPAIKEYFRRLAR